MTHLIDFFISDALELPKTWETYSGSFDEYIGEIFKTYKKHLRALAGHDYLTAEIARLQPEADGLCDAIMECLKEYLKGHPSSAYRVLATVLNKNRALIDSMCSKEIAKELTHLYRVRESSSLISDRGGLFHVPFESRHLVATARYSIPGLPCLYLGGSIWVCWKELQEPDENKLYISRFRSAPVTECRVLDLGFRPALWGGLINSGIYRMELRTDCEVSRLLAGNAIFWPLFAACSIRTRHKKASFRAEYIVPQLTLQWLTKETKIDGIRYFTTKLVEYARDPVAAANFVFPARDIKASGHCSQLASKFWLSDPLSWGDLQSRTPSGPAAPHLSGEIKTPAGLIVKYDSTPWAHAQNVLSGSSCGRP